MKYAAALSLLLAALAAPALAAVEDKSEPAPKPAQRAMPVHPPEWLSALPAPVGPAAHAAGLPMPDELLLAFAGMGVAAVGWRLRRRN